jgi:hypothetical protein
MAETKSTDLLPSTTGLDLGSPTQQWDLFAQNITATGTVSLVAANITPKSLQGIRFAGQTFSGGATIQAAINDAGTTGAVIIPPDYSGTDTYTNTNKIQIYDYRGNPAIKYGIVNVKVDCGAVGNNIADDYNAIQNCITNNPGKHIIFPGGTFAPSGGGTADVPTYYVSQQLVVSGNGTWLDGTSPSVWNALVGIRFPSGIAGVRFDKNCLGCKISNLGIIGSDAWVSTSFTTWPDWTPTLLTGDGIDGLQLLGGEPIVENCEIKSFARHGIFLDGASSIQSPSQPDVWRIENCLVSNNRAYGIHPKGGDANVGLSTMTDTRNNFLAGIYDYSGLGNTWIQPHSTLDGRSAISAGATSNITSISDSGSTLTITTGTAVAGWTSSAWITVAGTVNYNGTYKVNGGNSSNFTCIYRGTAHAGEAVGTAGTASSNSVYATLIARTALAGEAPIVHGCYASRSGSSQQVWINPYQESLSANPTWDTGTLVLGGQIVGTTPQTLGQGFTWIQNSSGGLLVSGGQGATIKNPADSMLSLSLRAGATARQNVTLAFLTFDGSTNTDSKPISREPLVHRRQFWSLVAVQDRKRNRHSRRFGHARPEPEPLQRQRHCVLQRQLHCCGHSRKRYSGY